MCRGKAPCFYLVLLQAALRHGLVALLLEGDDDEGHEDVDEEEGEDHKVDHVEDGDLDAVARAWTLVLKGGVHRVLQDSDRRDGELLKWFSFFGGGGLAFY